MAMTRYVAKVYHGNVAALVALAALLCLLAGCVTPVTKRDGSVTPEAGLDA